MRLLFLSGIFILNIAAFSAQETSDDDTSIFSNYPATPWLRQTSLEKVSNGTDIFSRKLFGECIKENPKNLIMSPLGAAIVLAMSSFGAGPKTQIVFRDVLGLSCSEYRQKVGFQLVTDQLNSYKSVELHVANGAFLSIDHRPNPNYIQVISNAFRSEVLNIDFSKSVEASNLINKWCGAKTQNRIKEIVDAGDLDQSTPLVLVNAVYFKGTWLKKFDVSKTTDSLFFLDDKNTKQVETMNAVHNVRYGEYPEADAHFIELPYLSEDSAHNMSMFILLPKKINGLAHLEANFQKISIQELFKRGKYRDVQISLPKFKIESTLELKDPLSRMGMADIFDPKKADFSRILLQNSANVGPPEIYIEKIVQKAFIEINEEGTEAAAATAAIFAFRSAAVPKYLPFIVDHPFCFILAQRNENPLSLFFGHYTG